MHHPIENDISGTRPKSRSVTLLEFYISFMIKPALLFLLLIDVCQPLAVNQARETFNCSDLSHSFRCVCQDHSVPNFTFRTTRVSAPSCVVAEAMSRKLRVGEGNDDWINHVNYCHWITLVQFIWINCTWLRIRQQELRLSRSVGKSIRASPAILTIYPAYFVILTIVRQKNITYSCDNMDYAQPEW